ncbi:unnamed protein product [Parnassius apollo]|uniref:(apollo) hypothetical protein n=1 Tax=Parnassius apollo TaxID=110799 RepID=A0A8S3Y3N4_PARAO|nr:unnamed protein product [Parnassius apollo]
MPIRSASLKGRKSLNNNNFDFTWLDQTKDEFVTQPHNESDENNSSSPKKTPESVRNVDNTPELPAQEREEFTDNTITNETKKRQ